MKKLFLFATILIFITSCTDVEGSKKALIQSGYHPIDVGGYGWWLGGSGDDIFVTKFKAYSPDSSQIVTGVVCKGLLKGKTIRLD